MFKHGACMASDFCLHRDACSIQTKYLKNLKQKLTKYCVHVPVQEDNVLRAKSLWKKINVHQNWRTRFRTSTKKLQLNISTTHNNTLSTSKKLAFSVLYAASRREVEKEKNTPPPKKNPPTQQHMNTHSEVFIYWETIQWTCTD